MSKVLCLAIPSRNPEDLRTMVKSLGNLESAKDYIGFGINFNGNQYTNPEIIEIINEIKNRGFDVKYVRNNYEYEPGMAPLIQIREDAAGLYPDALFYGHYDDDMKFIGKTDSCPFTAGDQFLWAIHFMLSNPDCGMIQLRSSMLRSVPKYHIKYTTPVNDYFATTRGIIVNSLKDYSDSGYIFPKSSHNLPGGNEETLAAAFRVYHGLFCAKMSNTKCHHYADGKLVNHEIVNNYGVGHYIAQNYKSDFYFCKEINAPNIVREGFEYNKNKVDIDYSEYSIDRLKSEIEAMLIQKDITNEVKSDIEKSSLKYMEGGTEEWN